MKTLGETVRFNQDLNINFDANLIDFLEVYNPSDKEFTKCEHWGWNEEGENNMPFYDFGIIADFDFDISKKRTLFYFGDSPTIGYYPNEPEKLVVLPRGHFLTGDLIVTGTFNFEKEYESPKTMLDLANFIDNFLFERTKFKLQLQKEQLERFKIKNKPIPKNTKPLFKDLPF